MSYLPFYSSMRLILTGLILIFLFSCSSSSVDKTQVESSHTDTTKHISMDSIKKEIADEITALIKSGFFHKEETFENIQDMFYDETLDEAWVKQEIEKQYEQRLAEQATWEMETDFDRLAQVFDKLNSSGIIALHNAGYTRQDGEGDTEEIHEQLKAKGIKTKGYCFYHTQDMDRAVDGDNLFLAFGDFEGDDKLGEDIGKEIVAALHEKRFKTDWNGRIEKRIEVVRLKWQKRFGNENCSNERAIQLFSKR
jgi:hypothetical protein